MSRRKPSGQPTVISGRRQNLSNRSQIIEKLNSAGLVVKDTKRIAQDDKYSGIVGPLGNKIKVKL